MLSAAIPAYLATQPAVVAALGDRIYHGIAPLTTVYPLVQFFLIGGRRLPSLDEPKLIKIQRVQLDVYAEQSMLAAHGQAAIGTHLATAEAIGLTLETAMETFRGVYGGAEILDCHVESERELNDADGTLARMSQDYEVWWRPLR